MWCVHVSKGHAQFVDTDGSNKADQRGSITKRLSLTLLYLAVPTHTVVGTYTDSSPDNLHSYVHTGMGQFIAINICLITWFLCDCNKCRLSTVDF